MPPLIFSDNNFVENTIHHQLGGNLDTRPRQSGLCSDHVRLKSHCALRVKPADFPQCTQVFQCAVGLSPDGAHPIISGPQLSSLGLHDGVSGIVIGEIAGIMS